MDEQDLNKLTGVTEEQLAAMSSDDLVALFVEQLLREKGVEVTAERKAELSDKLQQRIDLLTVQALPEADLKKLNESFDNGTATNESIQALVEGAGVDLEKVTEQALKEVRDEFLGKEEA